MKADLNEVTTPALRARLGVVSSYQPSKPSPSRPVQMVPIKPLPEGSIDLGTMDNRLPFGLDLEKLFAGRLLIQGTSGAGKSWLLRKLLEESAGLVQQIVLDPEHEFRSLAELLDYPIAEGHRIDLNGAMQLADRVRESRQSIVIDLAALERDRQMIFIATFLAALINSPEQHWYPAIVAIDEAHLFAPLGGQGFEGPQVRKQSVSAVVDLMSRGRKRGLVGVLSTQRLARLSKSVASEVGNFLIGKNTLDLDIRRSAETIGWATRRAFDRLPLLHPGEFVAVGPAFLPDTPMVVSIGPVKSSAFRGRSGNRQAGGAWRGRGGGTSRP